jgi:hypothetical protein
MPHFKIPGDRLITLPDLRVKYKDIFDLREFYIALREWLTDHEYIDFEDKTEHWETQYGENNQDGVKEMWIWWRTHKVPKHGAYMTWYLDFDWHNIAIQPAEIVRDGIKVKCNKGEVEIYIKPYLELNFVKDFQKHWFLKYFTKLFKNRIYHTQIEKRRKELYQETYELQHFMKQWLKLKRYLPYEEVKGFYPSFAWPSHLPEEK